MSKPLVTNKQWPTMALLVAMAVSLGIFIARGPMRADANSRWDAVLIMSAARTWFEGKNPYSAAEVDECWEAIGGNPEYKPSFRGSQSLVYPPGTWAVASLWTLFPAGQQVQWWIAASTVLYLCCVLMAIRLANLEITRASACLFVALGLCLGAAHTTIMLGQTSILALFLVLIGVTARGAGNELLAGLALGTASAIKPQLGFLFVVFEMGRGRWRVVAWSLAAMGVLTLIGVLRLEAAGVDWWNSWRQNIADFGVGHADPASPLVEGRAHEIINLESPLIYLIGDRLGRRITVYVFLAGAILAYFLVDRRRDGARGELESLAGREELCSLSMVSVITLLAAYHRYYDVVFVLIPLALASRLLALDWRKEAAAVLVACAPLMIPGPSALYALQRNDVLPRWIVESPLWRMSALGMHTWALVALAIVLVWVRWQIQRPAGVASRGAPPTPSASL